MSDPDLKLSDPWITSIQSLQPASTGIDERELFYRAGFQAALRQQAGPIDVQSQRRSRQRSRLRIVASVLWIAAASTAGYFVGRSGTLAEPQPTNVVAAPSTANEANEGITTDTETLLAATEPAANTVLVIEPNRTNSNQRSSWLSQWLPRPFEPIAKRDSSQVLIAFPGNQRADDWMMKSGLDAFVDQKLSSKSPGRSQATKLISTSRPSKTLTASDLHEISKEWESFK